MTVEKLIALIGADIAPFKKAMAEAVREAQTYTREVDKAARATVASSKEELKIKKELEAIQQKFIQYTKDTELAQKRLTIAVAEEQAARNKLNNLYQDYSRIKRGGGTQDQLTLETIKQEKAEMALEKAKLRVAVATNAVEKSQRSELAAKQQSIAATEALTLAKNAATEASIAEAAAMQKATLATIEAIEAERALQIQTEKTAAAQAVMASYFDTSQRNAMGFFARMALGNQSLVALNNSARKLQTTLASTGQTLSWTLTAPIVAVATGAIGAAITVDKYKNSLLVAMHSASRAEVEFKKLVEASRMPGVTLQGLLKASVGLQTIGYSADKARFTLMQFGNELAKFGGTEDEFRRIAENIVQVSGMKTFVGQEILQMQRLLPSVKGIMTQLYGTAEGKDLAKMGKTGLMVMQDLAMAFSKTARAANTTQNDIKNFKNEVLLLANEIGQQLVPIMREAMRVMGDWMRSAVKWFKDLTPETRTALFQLTGFLAILGPISLGLSGLVGIGRVFIYTLVGIRAAIALTGAGFAVLSGGMTTAAVSAQSLALATSLGVAPGLAAMGASAAAILAPVAAVAAAIAGLVALYYGLQYAIDAYAHAGLESTKALEREHEQEVKANQEKLTSLVRTKELADEYNNLIHKKKLTVEESKRLYKLFNDITAINPDLTKGYDAQGYAIHGLTGEYNRLGDAIRRATELARQQRYVTQVAPRLEALMDRQAAAREKMKSLTGPTTMRVGGAPEAVISIDQTNRSFADPYYEQKFAAAKSELFAADEAMRAYKKTMLEASAATKSLADNIGGDHFGGGGGKPPKKGGHKGLTEAQKALRAEMAETKKSAEQLRDTFGGLNGEIDKYNTLLSGGTDITQEENKVLQYRANLEKQFPRSMQGGMFGGGWLGALKEEAIRVFALNEERKESIRLIKEENKEKIKEFETALKSLSDMAGNYQGLLDKPSSTESSKAESKISKIIQQVGKSAYESSIYLRAFVDYIRSAAKILDSNEVSKLTNSIFGPLDASRSAAQESLKYGGASDRLSGLRSYIQGKLSEIVRLSAMQGNPGLGGILSNMSKISGQYNETWLMQQRAARLAEIEKSHNERVGWMIDQQKDLNKQMEIAMSFNPFEAWYNSLDILQQNLPKDQLFELFRDRSILAQAQTFAQGVTEIFTTMANDIATKGFGGMFTSIYQGFQKLLFKMAVEWLASQLYQMVLRAATGFMSGIFGGAVGAAFGGGGVGTPSNIGIQGSYMALGGPISGGEPYIVGEHGRELFIPGNNGYMISNTTLNNMGGVSHIQNRLGGGYSLSHYNSITDSSLTNQTNVNTSNSSSAVVVVNNYYGNEGRSGSQRTQSQIVLDAQRQASAVRARLG